MYFHPAMLVEILVWRLEIPLTYEAVRKKTPTQNLRILGFSFYARDLFLDCVPMTCEISPKNPVSK